MKTTETDSIIEKARNYVAAMPPAISGKGGHGAAFNVAVALRYGFDLSEEESLLIMSAYSQRCKPPWSEEELKHKLADGGKATKHSRPRGYLRAGTYTPSAKPAKPAKPLQLRGVTWQERVAEIGRTPEESTDITPEAKTDCLIDDGRGNMIPDHPGEVIPVPQLPADHPAVQYLVNRGYDINRLYEQFRISFCTKEAPEDRNRSRFYREVYRDFKDTPQNRIIFYADMHGVHKGWQARVIDHVAGDRRYYLHPYTNSWMEAEYRGEDGKWHPLPEIVEAKGKFDVSKYKTAFSASRSEMLMGLGAAVKWNNQRRPGKPRVAIITQSPLEAGRFGPPGIALLNRYFSLPQFRPLAADFGSLIYAGKNDEVSRALGNDIQSACAGKIQFAPIYPPAEFMDFGAMRTLQAIEHMWPVLHQFQ
jgi:hypothetical protein